MAITPVEAEAVAGRTTRGADLCQTTHFLPTVQAEGSAPSRLSRVRASRRWAVSGAPVPTEARTEGLESSTSSLLPRTCGSRFLPAGACRDTPNVRICCRPSDGLVPCNSRSRISRRLCASICAQPCGLQISSTHLTPTGLLAIRGPLTHFLPTVHTFKADPDLISSQVRRPKFAPTSSCSSCRENIL